MDDQFEFEKQLAINNMRSGVIAGMVVFGILLGQFLIAQLSQTSHPALTGLEDPWAVVDIIVVFLLLWGITRHSRLSAILLFSLYLVDKIMGFLQTGSFALIIIGSIFLFFFARAIKGTFDYHKLMRRADENYQPTKKWMWWLMTPVVLVLAFFMTVGVLVHYEVLPASYVKSNQDITADDLLALSELNLISEETEVNALYSYGLLSIKEGGVFMTDSELVIYAEEAGETYYDSMMYEEIDWVKQLSQGSDYADALYQVAGREQYQGFQFMLSVENNGHTVFIQNLKTKINPPMPIIDIPLPEINWGDQRNSPE